MISTKTSLVEQVVDALTEDILERRKPGDRMPTVAQVSTDHAVSRAVVREALATLAAKGLVHVKHGDGIYVRAPHPSDLSDVLRLLVKFEAVDSRTFFMELMELRSVLETEVTRLAASRATPEDLAHIGEAWARGATARRLGDQPGVNGADLDFHGAIAHASHNALLIVLMDVVRPLLAELRDMYPAVPVKSAAHDHENIVDSILRRAADEAAASARAHVRHVDAELSRKLFDVPPVDLLSGNATVTGIVGDLR